MSKSSHGVCNHLCNHYCNTGVNVANGVRPLPGVLDPRTFGRVKIELGRCDVCGVGKAAYRAHEAQTIVC